MTLNDNYHFRIRRAEAYQLEGLLGLKETLDAVRDQTSLSELSGLDILPLGLHTGLAHHQGLVVSLR